MRPKVSIIVPVYQDWSRVPVLLEAIGAQTLSEKQFELLLVDNGSDSIPDTSAWPPFAQLLRCDTPGSYAARNSGIAHARGELLVFTDADCRPEPDWLEKLLDRQAREEGDGEVIVAGAIRVVAEGDMTAAARYDEMMGLTQARYVDRGYAATANLSVPRRLFKRIGGFDSRRFSGGDASFCRYAVSRGARLVYCPEAIVRHPARRSLAELVRKVRRVKGGQIRNGPWSRRFLYGVRGFLPPVRAWARIWCQREVSAHERFVISGVQARLWIAEMTETVRLISGARPERR